MVVIENDQIKVEIDISDDKDEVVKNHVNGINNPEKVNQVVKDNSGNLDVMIEVKKVEKVATEMVNLIRNDIDNSIYIEKVIEDRNKDLEIYTLVQVNNYIKGRIKMINDVSNRKLMDDNEVNVNHYVIIKHVVNYNVREIVDKV